MYFIDTNIFLEWLLGRTHKNECEKLINMAQKGKLKLICSRFSIYSICIYITKLKEFKVAHDFIRLILETKNIEMVNTSLNDDLKIIQTIEKTNLDFDDALQYYLAKETNCKAIITFDKDFKKTKIKTIVPAQIVNY